jgi:hypothetical protein
MLWADPLWVAAEMKFLVINLCTCAQTKCLTVHTRPATKLPMPEAPLPATSQQFANLDDIRDT